MNTDVILDFIVDYYIWFIVGGLILILALVGFVVDKKNLLSKNKKKVTEEDNAEINAITIDNDEQALFENDKPIENSEIEENKFDDNVEILDDFSDDNSINSVAVDNFDNSVSEKQENVFSFEESDYVNPENNLNFTLDGNNIADKSDDNLENTDFNMGHDYEVLEQPIVENNNINDELFFQENKLPIVDLMNENEELSQPVVNEESISNKEYNLSEEIKNINTNINEFKTRNEDLSLRKVDETIDKINHFDFSIDSKKDELEDTMQISYSQLKEMVEDIIEENEKNKSLEINNNISNLETIDNSQTMDYNNDTNVSLSKLDSSVIENIKEQDDDDDVWKF